VAGGTANNEVLVSFVAEPLIGPVVDLEPEAVAEAAANLTGLGSPKDFPSLFAPPGAVEVAPIFG
jgi:hypothetical protein